MSHYQKPDSEELDRLAIAIKGGLKSIKELKTVGFSATFLTTYRMTTMRRIQRGEI